MEEISISAMIMAAPLLAMWTCWIKPKYALQTLLVLTVIAIGIPIFKDIFSPMEFVPLVDIWEYRALVLCGVFDLCLDGCSSGPNLKQPAGRHFYPDF